MSANEGVQRRYRIQSVSRMTGIATPLLRAWERRHHLVVPERGTSGYREYTDEDVELLQRARRLLERGYTIGEVARLGRSAILAAREEEALLPGRVAGSDDDLAALVDAFMEAAQGAEVARAEQVVARAFHSPELGLVLRRFVAPVLVAVGDAWEAGEFSPGIEHLATQLIRQPLVQLLMVANTGLGPVQAVVATGPGDFHELGALIVAVELARAGKRVAYLGANLPFVDLAQVVELTRARLACVSFVQRLGKEAMLTQLDALQRAMPKGVAVAVGGRGVEPFRQEAVERGLRFLEVPQRILESTLAAPLSGPDAA